VTGRKFTCSACGNEFESGWSEAEAIAEARALFAGDRLRHLKEVCDDCYSAFLKWFNGLSDEQKAELAAESRAAQTG
jgi:hypothetical protein